MTPYAWMAACGLLCMASAGGAFAIVAALAAFVIAGLLGYAEAKDPAPRGPQP